MELSRSSKPKDFHCSNNKIKAALNALSKRSKKEERPRKVMWLTPSMSSSDEDQESPWDEEDSTQLLYHGATACT